MYITGPGFGNQNPQRTGRGSSFQKKSVIPNNLTPPRCTLQKPIDPASQSDVFF
jgi:ABC-type uncharacterized transport system YnjBCD substrate-binding protein